MSETPLQFVATDGSSHYRGELLPVIPAPAPTGALGDQAAVRIL